MQESEQVRSIALSNVICLPTCKCNAGRIKIQRGVPLEHRIQPHPRARTATLDRVAMVREYLAEMKDLILRIETLATIEEKSSASEQN